MFFFFKKPTITLDCFTTQSNVYHGAPIEKATKFFPEWWKNIPNHTYDESGFYEMMNMKRCSGFIDYYKKGIMIPMWSDFAIDIKPLPSQQYRWQFSDGITEAEIHNSFQRGDYLQPPKYCHVKINTP